MKTIIHASRQDLCRALNYVSEKYAKAVERYGWPPLPEELQLRRRCDDLKPWTYDWYKKRWDR